MRPRRILPLFTVGWLLLPASAYAGDPAAAQALFDQAKQLADEGRYADACPKFAESQKLDPGIGTKFHLADCWQRVGRTATAWATFREVESEARASGQSSRERVAHDRAAALEPMVPKIQIDAEAVADTPGLTITRDGTPVSRETWGVPVPIDPGPHVVVVNAPNKQSKRVRVDVAPSGDVTSVQVQALADLAPAPVAPGPAPAAPPPAPVAAAPVSPPAPTPPYPMTPYAPLPPRSGVTQAMPTSERPVIENGGGAARAVGWFLVGAGIAGIGAGTYFLVKWVDAENSTDPTVTRDIPTQRTATAIAGGAGIAALVLGVAVVASAPSPHVVMTTASPRVELTPMVGARTGGLSLHGSW